MKISLKKQRGLPHKKRIQKRCKEENKNGKNTKKQTRKKFKELFGASVSFAYFMVFGVFDSVENSSSKIKFF